MNERRERESADDFVGQAKAAFDRSVDRLDGATLSRLNRGRQKALEQAGGPVGAYRPRWMPLVGVTCAAAVAAVMWFGVEPSLESAAPATATDLEIILHLDDFEMLENLEFYSWVELDELLDRA